MSYVAKSQRLWLQPLSIETHLEGYHALFSDERVSRWSYRKPSATLSDTEELMKKRLPSEKEPWMENYAILVRPSETKKAIMIGSIGIPRLSHDGKAAEVGYGIHPDYWGSGYATEALELFVSHYWTSKRQEQKEVLVADTEPENVPSERVLAKAGFKRGPLVKGAFEVTDLVTGELVKKDATIWQYDRPKGLHEMMISPGAMMWSTKYVFTDIQQTRDLIVQSSPTPEKPWNQRWAITLKTSDGSMPKMIGIIGIVREREVGYKLNPGFWRMGYMTEALAVFIEMFWASESNAKYDQLLACADPTNIPSMKTLIKAGFEKAEYRKAFYERGCQPGVKSDLQVFSLDRPKS